MNNSKNHQNKDEIEVPPVIVTPDPRLRRKSEKIHHIDAETHRIIREMIQSSLDWEKEHEFELTTAMAAPQLGYNKRIIVVREDMSDKDHCNFIPLINPEVIKADGKPMVDYEGCLSVPSIYGKVTRPSKVRIKALTEEGEEVRIKAHDFLARVLQHEIDHLDGILFVDHIKNDKNAFFKLNEKGDIVPVDYDKYIKDNKELFPDTEEDED